VNGWIDGWMKTNKKFIVQRSPLGIFNCNEIPFQNRFQFATDHSKCGLAWYSDIRFSPEEERKTAIQKLYCQSILTLQPKALLKIFFEVLPAFKLL
jgi:hypothetical protein